MNAEQKHPWIVLADQLEAQDKHYPVAVPDREEGDWMVSTVKVDRNEGYVSINNLRYIRDRLPECVVSSGTYKRLVYQRRQIVMSNTQMEYRTNCLFVASAIGEVLVTGLGLGMILRPLIANTAVKTVTVVEREVSVIALVAPTYQDLVDSGKLILIQDDATTVDFSHRRRKFDCAWHDIWGKFGSEYLPEYAAIRAHHRPWCKRQGCWAESLSRRMAKIERQRECA